MKIFPKRVNSKDRIDVVESESDDFSVDFLPHAPLTKSNNPSVCLTFR
jgi:hypothetical protein